MRWAEIVREDNLNINSANSTIQGNSTTTNIKTVKPNTLSMSGNVNTQQNSNLNSIKPVASITNQSTAEPTLSKGSQLNFQGNQYQITDVDPTNKQVTLYDPMKKVAKVYNQEDLKKGLAGND